MAKSKKKAAPPAARGGGRAPARSQSRKAAPKAAVAEIEVVEEEKGMGLEDGIVLFTTIALVAAIVLVEIALQKFYGAGAFG